MTMQGMLQKPSMLRAREHYDKIVGTLNEPGHKYSMEEMNRAIKSYCETNKLSEFEEDNIFEVKWNMMADAGCTPNCDSV